MKQTLINLTKAYIGESQARNRYNFYAKVAKKEGYEQIAAVFSETEEQEKTHAKRLYEHIQELKENDENVIVEAEAPIVYGDTKANLAAAISGENYESSEMYPEFAKVAEEEGLEKIATRLKSIANAEAHHQEKYEKLLANLENGKVFERDDKNTTWVCRECGYIHIGKTSPKECPSCDHPRAYYQIKSEEY